MEDMIIKEMKTSTASEDFKKNRLSGTRYVDKTAILVPLLRGDHESNFFLRPRRFGKTLTLSMIRYFVEDTRDEATRDKAERMEEIITDRVLQAMSYFDTLEAFYHGAMLTLLGLNEDYICRSNRESGDGRFDVLCKQRRRWKLAFVLEFKISEKAKDLRKDAQKAAEQIDEMRYSADLLDEGYEKVMAYGISFYEKRCRVAKGNEFVQL